MFQDTSVSAFANSFYHHLGKKAFWYLFAQKMGAGTSFLLIALGLSILGPYVPDEMAVMAQAGSRLVFLVAIIALLGAYVAAKLIHKNTGFMLASDALKIKRGVFHKEELAIPYRQIQNIEIERSLSQQILGLSTVIILTAGSETEQSKKDDPESILPAVDKEIASMLQDELLKRANVQKVVETGNNPHA